MPFIEKYLHDCYKSFIYHAILFNSCTSLLNIFYLLNKGTSLEVIRSLMLRKLESVLKPKPEYITKHYFYYIRF